MTQSLTYLPGKTSKMLWCCVCLLPKSLQSVSGRLVVLCLSEMVQTLIESSLPYNSLLTEVKGILNSLLWFVNQAKDFLSSQGCFLKSSGLLIQLSWVIQIWKCVYLKMLNTHLSWVWINVWKLKSQNSSSWVAFFNLESSNPYKIKFYFTGFQGNFSVLSLCISELLLRLVIAQLHTENPSLEAVIRSEALHTFQDLGNGNFSIKYKCIFITQQITSNFSKWQVQELTTNGVTCEGNYRLL